MRASMYCSSRVNSEQPKLTPGEINLRHTSPALFYTFFLGFVNYMWYYINTSGTIYCLFGEGQIEKYDQVAS